MTFRFVWAAGAMFHRRKAPPPWQGHPHTVMCTGSLPLLPGVLCALYHGTHNRITHYSNNAWISSVHMAAVENLPNLGGSKPGPSSVDKECHLPQHMLLFQKAETYSQHALPLFAGSKPSKPSSPPVTATRCMPPQHVLPATQPSLQFPVASCCHSSGPPHEGRSWQVLK